MDVLILTVASVLVWLLILSGAVWLIFRWQKNRRTSFGEGIRIDESKIANPAMVDNQLAKDANAESVEDLLRRLIKENQEASRAANRTTRAIRAIYWQLSGFVIFLNGALLIIVNLTSGNDALLGVAIAVVGLFLGVRMSGKEYGRSDPNK